MEITVKIPENLKIEDLLKAAGEKSGNKQIDKIAFICSSLHNSAASNREAFNKYQSKDINKRPYYPLYSVILKKNIHDYNRVLALIITKLGIIETDNHFIIGEKSRGYRFAERYFGVKFIEHTIVDFTLHQNIQQYLTRKSKIQFDTDENTGASGVASEYSFLLDYWDKKKLKIEFPAALDWANTISDVRLARLGNVADEAWELGRKKIIENRELLITLIERIDKGQYYFSVDNFDYRFHSNLTNLKKEVRNFISYNGEKLVAVDIRNSSLYFMIAIFNKDFWGIRKRYSKNLLTLAKLGLYDEVGEKVIGEVIDTIMLLENSERPFPKGFRELDIFTKLAVAGLIYDDVLADYKDADERRVNMTRDDMKYFFMVYLFHDPTTDTSFASDNNPVSYLSDYYPEITKLLSVIKSQHYKVFSKILHRIESYLVIEIICKRFSKEVKEAPLFTIHDSIITTESYAGALENIMAQELEKYIGFKPPLSQEVWQATPHIYRYDDIEFIENMSDYFPDGFTDADLFSLAV